MKGENTMIICTNDDVLRTFAECSAWEKLCLKERLWQGCDFTYDLSAKEQDYVESFGCSADIPDDFCIKAFGSTVFANEDFLR